MITRSFTKQNIGKMFLFLLLCLIATSISQNAFAFQIESNPSASIENNFIVGPAKIELNVPEGASKTVNLVVENRTGRDETFEISFEDFTASDVAGETVKLLGDATSKTSLKDFFFVERKSFVLSHGDRLILPVVVTVPANTTPGGKFASVVVSAIAPSTRVTESNRSYTGAAVLGRVATLFFVTVPGDTVSQGELISLKTKNQKKIFFTNEIPFRLEYKNSGTVSLNPYGVIEVKSLFGRVVDREILDPWYTLPDSMRTRDVVVKGSFFGRFKASAQVNRGYEDIVDTQDFTFYVVSPSALVMLIIIVILAIFVIRKKVRYQKESHE